MIELPRRFVLVVGLPVLLVLSACTTSGGATAPATAPGTASATASAPTTSAPTATAGTASAIPTAAGGDGDYDYGETPAPTAASADPGDAAQVGTGTTPAGTALTGANGMTLYTFAQDSANASACSGGCAAKWPPLTVASGLPTAGTGVTGDLTTFARSDGSMQVAYDSQPLYYYADDTAPGDANGQGVGEVWFIAEP